MYACAMLCGTFHRVTSLALLVSCAGKRIYMIMTFKLSSFGGRSKLMVTSIPQFSDRLYCIYIIIADAFRPVDMPVNDSVCDFFILL